MKAKDQTEAMLGWWRRAGVDRADIAVRRPDGAMLWHHDLPLDELPLAWCRAENVRRGDVYVRPARGHDWPMVFLDDVPDATAQRVVRKYAALAIRTSSVGGCHLWVLCRRRLAEDERATAQRWVAPRVGADPGSVSGEHLGRLAGFKNWKRGGTWVNVSRCSGGEAWDPAAAVPHRLTRSAPSAPRRPQGGRDTSESGREWGWVCGRLERGGEPREIYADLASRARGRRGSDATRYARITLTRALLHVRGV